MRIKVSGEFDVAMKNKPVKLCHIIALGTLAAVAVGTLRLPALAQTSFGFDEQKKQQAEQQKAQQGAKGIDQIIKNANSRAASTPTGFGNLAPAQRTNEAIVPPSNRANQPNPTTALPTAAAVKAPSSTPPQQGNMRSYVESIMNKNSTAKSPTAVEEVKTVQPVEVPTAPTVGNNNVPQSDPRLWSGKPASTGEGGKPGSAVTTKGVNDWGGMAKGSEATKVSVGSASAEPEVAKPTSSIVAMMDEKKEEEKASYEPDYSMPVCAASTVKQDPLGSLSMGVQLYNSVFYDPNDYKQVQKAKNSSKHVVAYNAKGVDYDPDNPKKYDFWSEFAVISGVECLPTSIEFVASDEGNYLEIRTGEKVWE